MSIQQRLKYGLPVILMGRDGLWQNGAGTWVEEKIPLECYHSGWDQSWRQAHLEMMVKPYDFTIFVVNHPNVFFFFRLSRGVPWKNFHPPDWCEKQVKFLAETLNFSLFTLDISRRYHGCGKLRTRVGLVERRHLCDTRKEWDVRLWDMRCQMWDERRWEEMRMGGGWDEMRWNGMWCLGGWKHENMACGTSLALSGDDFQWFTTMSKMETII